MDGIILNYIIQAVLGAASGYITNDYAINMLFKEYTPLKIGGVIKKTRTEFIDNLSSLVENDIINKDKLNAILSDEKFIEKFEAITEDFFSSCLYKAAGNDTISDINGIASSIESTGEFVKKILNAHTDEVTKFLLNNINAEDFITDKQIDKISSAIVDSAIDSLNNSGSVTNILHTVYSEKKDIKLHDLVNIPDEKISDISDKLINEFIEHALNDSSGSIDDSIIEITKSIGFDNLVTSIKHSLYDKSIGDIVNIDEDFINKTPEVIINYINSNQGQKLLVDISESLFLYLRGVDKTLFEIADSPFEINLKSYLADNLPKVTENTVEWINLNRKNIDKIIEDSIDEVIQESDKMKAMLLNTIKNSYLNNLSEKFNIVQKIIDFIEKETEPDKLSSSISSKIIEYLENTSVGDIVKAAEANEIITPSVIKHYMEEFLITHIDSIFKQALNFFMNLKLNQVMPEKFVSYDLIKEKIIQVVKEKIVYSKHFNQALSIKASNAIIHFMEKNIGEIISEDTVDDFNHKTNETIIKYLRSNSATIKCQVEVLIEKFKLQNLLNSVGNTEKLSELATKEIIKKYYIFTGEIKSKNVSSAIDKINTIDNLSKNSSEMLRGLIVNNLDTLLSGSVKAIVYENLNKLSDDELVDFANDFIGRELKPIMFFGALLGTVAGLILAAIQNHAPEMSAITFENMFTYALVGFMTNVIAINMIFKPYEEVQFLKNIPFLRNFSIGYLVKNQKIFAKTTANFVDNNLLSKESINDLFGKYEDDMKKSFVSSIQKDDYNSLHNLLNNNRESIVSSSYNFTKNMLDKNTEAIGRYAFKNISNINCSSLLSEASINYLSNSSVEWLQLGKDKACEHVFSLTMSEEPLNKIIPAGLLDTSKVLINKLIDKYYILGSESVKDIDGIKKLLLSYNEQYKCKINRRVDEIFSTEDIKKLCEFVSNRLTEMISSQQSRKNFNLIISNLFIKTFDKDKLVGELFDGKLKEYVNTNSPMLFDKISDYIKLNIVKNKAKVSLSVQNEIKQNLGMLEKGMYTLMGGEKIVDELITKIMTVKLPKFIDEKNQELHNIFSETIVEPFYNIPVQKVHESINKVQIDEIIDNYFLDEGHLKYVETKVASFSSSLGSRALKTNMNNILKLIRLDDLESIYNYYSVEINELTTNLSCNLINKKDEIMNILYPIMDKTVDNFVNSVHTKDLFDRIEKDDIENSISSIEKNLMDDDLLKKSINSLLNDYKEFIGDKKLNEFINEAEFENAAQKSIKGLLNNEDTEIFTKNLYNAVLKEATDCKLSFIDKDTKSYVINRFAEAGIESIRRNLDSMLRAVEFDKIAKEEIEAMKPRKIHEMFNSFCGKYFKRLMVYGFGGFVFGINMYIGLGLTGLKIIKEKFIKN